MTGKTFSPRQAYQAGLDRYTVKDRGRLQQKDLRCEVRDGATGKPVGAWDWHNAYLVRRMLAAKHAATVLGCRDRLDTDMGG